MYGLLLQGIAGWGAAEHRQIACRIDDEILGLHGRSRAGEGEEQEPKNQSAWGSHCSTSFQFPGSMATTDRECPVRSKRY
jgi:hypothetical protein